MALRNKESAMNKMSRCRTRNLAPVHSRRGRECDREGGGKKKRRERESRRRKKRRKRVGGEREEPAWDGEKGLVRDWSGKTMNAGGVENGI
ncbi:hypothetical protein TNCV_5136811 [Trichonephila clavipes]|nr:hypothetical protein TNCV_5136811 [Trichonephila clavipes]